MQEKKAPQLNKQQSPIIPQPKPQKATLKIPGIEKPLEFDILKPTLGPQMIDVRNLFRDTGMFTFDPGFMSTGSCASAITYIDGEKGNLWYRGYDIQDLAKNSTFIQVCFLLLYGELPSKNDLEIFQERVKDEMVMHEKLKDFYKGFNKDAHPMAIMVSVVGALSAFFHQNLDVWDPKQRQLSAIRLIAKFPSLAAAAFRTSVGLPIVQPNRKFSYAENFLYMMFKDPTDPDFKIPPVMTQALDKILTLHADHQQNASTFTVRIAGSSLANPYACIAAGIASLWGPAHGGANEACLKMLDKIGTKENIQGLIDDAKDKNTATRLMGFGHRVYKNFDPRSIIMGEMCHKLMDEFKDSKNKPLFQLAEELEKRVLKDEYFIKRKLYPNVDYYSGIVLEAMNIPRNMFTVIFAMSRAIGWITQWREMMSEKNTRIGRPRQLYVGNEKKGFISLKDRKDTGLFEYQEQLKKKSIMIPLPS